MGWEYNAFVMDLGVVLTNNINDAWSNRIGPDGFTNWEVLQRMGREGWELVSCFPVTSNGWTRQVVWTFKRPVGQVS